MFLNPLLAFKSLGASMIELGSDKNFRSSDYKL